MRKRVTKVCLTVITLFVGSLVYAVDKPVFTFIQITDTHIMDENVKRKPYPNSNQYLTQFIDETNKELRHPRPDFVLITGDLVDQGDKPSFVKLKEILSNLKCPYYLVAGNHDITWGDKQHTVTWDKTNYIQVFDTTCWNVAFSYKNLYFIGASLRPLDGNMGLDWIRKYTQENPKTPLVVFTHFPLYPIRDAAGLKTWGFAEIANLNTELRQIVESASQDRPVIYLYGHTHVTGFAQKGNVYQINTGALAGHYVGYRYFEVYPDKIKTYCYQILSKDKLPKVCERNATDSFHPDELSYNYGLPEEQELTIPLTVKKDLYIPVTYQFRDLLYPKETGFVDTKKIAIKKSDSNQITIDGKITEPVWSNSVTITDFQPLFNKPLSVNTTAYLTYDTDNLYIGVECYDTNISSLSTTKATKQDEPAFSDDAIEMFLDIANDQREYYHLVVNAGNIRYDARCALGGQMNDRVWNGDYQSQTFIDKDKWSIEVAIPFNKFGSGQQWGFNICRHRSADDLNLTWANVKTGFHEPAKFGKLVFK